MKARIIAAVVLAAALATVASTATGSTKRASAQQVVVWVMTDAQNGWPGAIAAANAQFQQQHPGVDVNIQYQSWDTVLQKFDSALAANDAPDVIELGNTQTAKYMAAGAFSSLKAKNFPNSSTWLSGLKASCTYRGKLYCVPYYAGARAVIYRKDMYRKAGVKGVPKTYAQFLTANKKLMKKFGKNRNFSAFYEPGQNWYVVTTFVEDWGGHIAVRLQPEGRRSAEVLRKEDGRLPDAQPHQGPLHADLPGRLRPRHPDLGPQQAARGRLDQGVHRHAVRDPDRQGREHRELDDARERERAQSVARPVREGGQVQLVRPDVAELGQRREQPPAEADAHRDPHEPEVRAGRDQEREQPNHADPQRFSVSSRPGSGMLLP